MSQKVPNKHESQLSMHFNRYLRLLTISATVSLSFASDAGSGVTADEALARLVEGNQRFTSGSVVHPHQTVARRTELAKGQAPIAIVLTCSDSRVAPELYFDQGLGDLFVIRNAGNVLNDHVLGSVEYAVEHLHVPLIVVVGHEKCGAVGAAVGGGEAPGHIASIVHSIRPAVEAAKGKSGDQLDNCVKSNAQQSAQQMAQAKPFLHAAAQAGKLKIVAARYELATGKVEILP